MLPTVTSPQRESNNPQLLAPRAKTSISPKRREHASPESPKRRGIRSQGPVRGRLGPLKTKKHSSAAGTTSKSSRKKKRRQQERQKAQEHADLLAQAAAVQQAAFVRGLGAVTVGQDTPPMSAGSELQNDRRKRLYSPESIVYYDKPPPSSAYNGARETSRGTTRNRSVATHNGTFTSSSSSSSSYAPSRNSVTTGASWASGKSGVLPNERLHTPDLEMMKMAMHGSLFQRLRQNFKAGMFGSTNTVNGESGSGSENESDDGGNNNDTRGGKDTRGLDILHALNANGTGHSNGTEMVPFVEQDASTMMALTQSQPPEATTVLFGEGSPLSRQGFASLTPHKDRRRRKRKKKTKQTKNTTIAAPINHTAVSQLDPNFSRKLLPLADPSHYWDVRNVSHELKWSAITIQRYVRGLLAKLFTAEFRYQMKLKKMKIAHEKATLIQKYARRYNALNAATKLALMKPEGKFLMGTSLCEDPYQMKLIPLLRWINLVKGGSQGVQKIFRGMMGRRQALGHKIDVLRKRLEKKSATSIQTIVRGYKQPSILRARIAKCHVIRLWLLNRLDKMHWNRVAVQVRAAYVRKKAAAVVIQLWFPRAYETRGLARTARHHYLYTRTCIIKLQSFNRMIIATNRMHHMSAVREQERLAERRRIERERLAEIERLRIVRWTKAAIVIENWVRCLQAYPRVESARQRQAERVAEYEEAQQAYKDFKLIIPENGDVRKLTAKPLLGFIFMHVEPRLSDVKEDVALLSGKSIGLKLDVWYQHNMMTQPREPLLFYARSIVEYYRSVKLDVPEVQEFLRKGRLLDAGLVYQRKFVDILETAWRLDMDNGYKGCLFALAKVLFFKDMLGAARSMRRARKNSKYDAKIVAHANKFEKEFSALIARGDHFVDIIYETTLVLPPQRAKFRLQALSHENNLQFRALRHDFVTAGVKPSGAEARLVFTHLDAVNIAAKLDRPELTRSGRKNELVLSLVPMFRLETGAAAEKAKGRRPGGNKKKNNSKKAGGKRLVVRFKQEPFPQMTVLTKGRGKTSLSPKFLSVVALHRDDSGFLIIGQGDKTEPPPGNPNDEYKLTLPFKKVKALFLDYPVLWKSRTRPGWRSRSDQLIALVIDGLEICKKPKPEKKGVHEMTFEELMRMSAAVDQQKKQLEGDQKGEKVPDQPPELVLMYHNEKGRMRQAELGYGAQAFQKTWRGLKGRRIAKMAKENRASREIVEFIKYNRARVWFRDVTIYAKQHFRSIEMQSVARGFLMRLAFQRRLVALFPFSRGTWHVACSAMTAQRPLPLQLGYVLVANVSKLTLSDLTQRAMWTVAVDDDDWRVLNVLQGHDGLKVQPNLIYLLAIATRITMKKHTDLEGVGLVVQKLIEQARYIDPERGRKFNIVKDMFFQRWYNIQFHNPLKALRCAIVQEIIYNDYDQAQLLYDESKRLLDLQLNALQKISEPISEPRKPSAGKSEANIHGKMNSKKNSKKNNKVLEVYDTWQLNYNVFRQTLSTRIAAANLIQRIFRGHCNKRVNGEWLAALIKFRRTCLKHGFQGQLAQAFGFHYLWHDKDRAIELYTMCHRLNSIGTFITEHGRDWLEDQFDMIDKLQRGGITEAEYPLLLEKCAIPELEGAVLHGDTWVHEMDEEEEAGDAGEEEDGGKDGEGNGDDGEGGEKAERQTPTTITRDHSVRSVLSNLGDRKDKTHFFQPLSQASRDIFQSIGTTDGYTAPTLDESEEYKTTEQQLEEEELQRELTKVETDAMDHFGDVPKNNDGLRISCDHLWDWAMSISGGSQCAVLHIGSTLVNMLNMESMTTNQNWTKAMRACMHHLEELNLTEDTLHNRTKEENNAVLELETNYIRLAARMPQERSASLVNHALFLHVVRQNSQGAGDSYSSALIENPGYLAARRGYDYFLNQGMLSDISPKQQKIQLALRRKREKMMWRRQTVSKEDRIAQHLSVLMEEAARTTLNYEEVEKKYLAYKAMAKKINKFRDKEEYTEDDKIQMKHYRHWKRELKIKQSVMDDANNKVLQLRQEREDRVARNEERTKE